MQSIELRRRFLAFFEARNHTVIQSDGLIPKNDPTVLFTSAGMNQFKPYFLGLKTDLKRAASCQKCLRTQDLERVGKTASHHSFFEMLGNFSFGDYFKKDAIGWAWEFLTGTVDFSGTLSPDRDKLCLSLPAERLWVSVYEEDEETFGLWQALGVPDKQIKRFGQSENFWPANAQAEGPNGPCGPCSEIYYDPDGKVRPDKSIEVWNLVFTQFNRQPDGSLIALPKPNIDTGMGLERLTAVVQAVETDYETDLFIPIVEGIRDLSRGKRAKKDQVTFAQRAIADHLRAIVFLLAEGLGVSNESRGYVLRMLIRRAHRLGRIVLKMDQKESPAFLSKLAVTVERAMADSPYDRELAQKRKSVARIIQNEESQFVQTLEVGTLRLEEAFAALTKLKKNVIPGDEVFKLYDTYGFPIELTTDMAEERGFSVDRGGFNAELKAQQERSRTASQFGGEVFVADQLRVRQVLPDLPEKDAQFLGYELLEADCVVKGLWDGKEWVTQAKEGDKVGVVLDRSPFYGESGGQVGDCGAIECPRGRLLVTQTSWVDDVLVHHAVVHEGTVKVQDPVKARVDVERRLKIARSHTATHLLHWALRKVLGPESTQAGSFVEAERLRFDFSSLYALAEDKRSEVEALVNRRVALADDISAGEMPLKEAKESGALAMFGEKYGDTVRVVSIGDYSKELCGGTHLSHTGFIGTFKIVGESAIASGTRRVEAIVGNSAAERQHKDSRLLHEAARRLGRSGEEVLAGVEELLGQLKKSERERKALQQELARFEAARIVGEGKDINGVMFVTCSLKDSNREILAMLADAVKGRLEREGVVVLTSTNAGQVSVVVATTQQTAKRVHAGELLKAVAPIMQGSGGGRADFAQGGGREPAKIPAVFERAEEILREALGR